MMGTITKTYEEARNMLQGHKSDLKKSLLQGQ